MAGLIARRGRGTYDPGPALMGPAGVYVGWDAPSGVGGLVAMVAILVVATIGWTVVWDRAPARIPDPVLGVLVAAACTATCLLASLALVGGVVTPYRLLVACAASAVAWLAGWWLVPMRPSAASPTADAR